MNLIMENDKSIYNYSFVPQNIQVFALTSSQWKLSWWYYKTFISQQLTADFRSYFSTPIFDTPIWFIHQFLWNSRLWVIWLDSSVGRISIRCVEIQGSILRSIIFFCSVLLSSVGLFHHSHHCPSCNRNRTAAITQGFRSGSTTKSYPISQQISICS